MKRRPEDEAALFREAVRDVKPLDSRTPPSRPRRPGKRPSAPRRPASTGTSSSRLAAPLESGDSLRFARAGASRTLVRELRRGRLRPQAVLDLHGLPAARAERELRDFLTEAVAHGATCVRIVHGKGLHSGIEGPVLKNLVDATLRAFAQVRAFASAREADGGVGAVNVLLER